MDYNITFPEQIISNVNTGGIIMVSIIFVLGFIIFMRYAANIMPVFMGLLAHLLVVVAGVEVVTQIVTMIPGLGQMMLGTVLMFCLTRVVITALLVHATRWIVVSFANRNNNITLGDALIGGLGMGVSQAVVSGMDLMYISTLGTMINSEGMETLLEGMTAENISEVMSSIEQTISIPPFFFLLKGINNAMDIVYFVAACVIVYAIVKKGLKKVWYLAAIGVNMVMQAATMFGDYQIMDDYIVLTLVKLTALVVMIVFVFRIDARYLGGELRSFDKMRTKTAGSMPKFGKLKNK